MVASACLLGEVPVDELDGDGALPDGRCDALDGPVAHVTGGEHAGQAGLQEQRRARKRPACRRPTGTEEVTAGQQVASLVTPKGSPRGYLVVCGAVPPVEAAIALRVGGQPDDWFLATRK
jgi:hypothetical protein